jgi:acetolactate synthase I/II/III large subunit
MKVSDYIATYLQSKGVKQVFELSGGMITHLLDSFLLKTSIKIYSMHHEQAAAFAADAVGRVTGLPGIALATSGPGATNLLTGIGSCYFDSSPAIFITGQVNISEQKGNRKIRQLGFQETNIVSMAIPITKKSYAVTNANLIPQIFKEAFEIATSGRPGPVLIDIPMNIQRMDIEPAFLLKKETVKQILLENKVINNLIKDLQYFKKPLVLLGRGVNASFVKKELKTFLSKTKLPVVTSLLGLDNIEYTHSQRVGFIGSYGNRWANITLGECDLLVVIGSRLDIRQTGADTNYFANRKIYHIDCEKGEINNRIKGCKTIVTEVKTFLNSFNNLTKKKTFTLDKSWVNHINELKLKWQDTKELDCKGINPNNFMHLLSQKSKITKAYIADVGAHQMWAAQSLEIQKNQFFYTSGGMGAMGFALPAAIGASIAFNNKHIVAIIGDGCMQINIQELQTIVRNKLPIKIIVLNNESLGMITQFQQSYFEARYQSTLWGYSSPNFDAIAKAYNIESRTISKTNQIGKALDWLWNKGNADKPQLLQVMIEPLTNIYPKIAFGKPLTEMEPFAKPIEMEST